MACSPANTANSPTNTANPKQAPPTLLTIAREIRDIIYEFTFADVEITISRKFDSVLPSANSATETNKEINEEHHEEGHIWTITPNASALLATCRQLRAESLTAFYTLTTFTGNSRAVMSCMKNLDPEVRPLVNCVHVDEWGRPATGLNFDTEVLLHAVQSVAFELGVAPKACKALFWQNKGEDVWADKILKGEPAFDWRISPAFREESREVERDFATVSASSELLATLQRLEEIDDQKPFHTMRTFMKRSKWVEV